MTANHDEEKLLRTVAMQNTQSILQARQQADLALRMVAASGSRSRVKGSTFTVRLPALKSPPAHVAPETSATGVATDGPRRRILVVDDNRDAATSLASLLKMLGDEMCTAHAGSEALAAAETFRPGANRPDSAVCHLLIICQSVRLARSGKGQAKASPPAAR